MRAIFLARSIITVLCFVQFVTEPNSFASASSTINKETLAQKQAWAEGLHRKAQVDGDPIRSKKVLREIWTYSRLNAYFQVQTELLAEIDTALKDKKNLIIRHRASRGIKRFFSRKDSKEKEIDYDYQELKNQRTLIESNIKLSEVEFWKLDKSLVIYEKSLRDEGRADLEKNKEAALFLERCRSKPSLKSTSLPNRIFSKVKGYFSALFKAEQPIYERVDQDGKNFLTFAAETGSIDLLRALIKQGANLDVKSIPSLYLSGSQSSSRSREDFPETTALIAAIDNGQYEAAQILVEAGADLKLRAGGETALRSLIRASLAAPTLSERAHRIGFKNLVKVIIDTLSGDEIRIASERDDNGEDPRRPSVMSSENYSFNAVEKLQSWSLQEGFHDLSASLFKKGVGSERSRRLEVARPGEVLTEEELKYLALRSAAAEGNLQQITTLLRLKPRLDGPEKPSGGNFDAGTDFLASPLQLVLENTEIKDTDRLKAVQLLIDHGADLTRFKPGGASLLMQGSRIDSEGLVEKMIERLEAGDLLKSDIGGVNYIDREGNTAVTLAAANGRVKNLEILFKHGAIPFVPLGNHIFTPLMSAVNSGSLESVSLVLKNLKNFEQRVGKHLNSAATPYSVTAEVNRIFIPRQSDDFEIDSNEVKERDQPASQFIPQAQTAYDLAINLDGQKVTDEERKKMIYLLQKAGATGAPSKTYDLRPADTSLFRSVLGLSLDPKIVFYREEIASAYHKKVKQMRRSHQSNEEKLSELEELLSARKILEEVAECKNYKS